MTFEQTLCNVLTFILGVLFLLFAIFNACGRNLGTFGAQFNYEMDEVMGGLLGIAHYGIIEAVIFLVASLGALWTITNPGRGDILPPAALLIISLYFVMVVFYAHFEKQRMAPFAIFSAITSMMFVWRLVRFTDIHLYGDLLRIAIVCALLVGLCIWRMAWNAGARSACNDRFVRIQQFCDEHPDYHWRFGEDCPAGFVDLELSSPLTAR